MQPQHGQKKQGHHVQSLYTKAWPLHSKHTNVSFKNEAEFFTDTPWSHNLVLRRTGKPSGDPVSFGMSRFKTAFSPSGKNLGKTSGHTFASPSSPLRRNQLRKSGPRRHSPIAGQYLLLGHQVSQKLIYFSSFALLGGKQWPIYIATGLDSRLQSGT